MNTQVDMSRSQEATGGESKYKGIRRRRWGKWVSEIRVPRSRERLWLGSYATPEAAAVAHDTAVFFLRGPEWSHSLNFPDRAATYAWSSLSPRSIQTVASDSGMAVDAQLAARGAQVQMQPPTQRSEVGGMEVANLREGGGYGFYEGSELGGDISIEDMDIYM